MKVNELIAELSALPPDAEVIIQKDGEGNSYSPLYCVDGEAIYTPTCTWAGEVYATTWSADDACMSEEDWQEMLKKPRCVVLAPVN